MQPGAGYTLNPRQSYALMGMCKGLGSASVIPGQLGIGNQSQANGGKD